MAKLGAWWIACFSVFLCFLGGGFSLFGRCTDKSKASADPFGTGGAGSFGVAAFSEATPVVKY